MYFTGILLNSDFIQFATLTKQNHNLNKMKQIITIVLIIVLIIISGCTTEYEECTDDCARVKCGYTGSLKVVYSGKIDGACLNRGQTIREYCYEECK